MEGPVAAVPSGLMNNIPRSSSIDTAISAIASKTSSGSSSKSAEATPTDIAALIKAAGSPEAVIQHLLKEKHSQSQQNNQLWRLVDKQRAMVWGLNKDLEAAMKEKEKYRKKLKELMANPSVARVVGGPAREKSDAEQRTSSRADTETRSDITAVNPDSPVLESEGLKHSPVDVSMAPYPITPPADQPQKAQSPVAELLDPVRTMPKPQEHAVNKFNHAAEEEAEEEARKEKTDESVRELPYNASLPPSRSLPSQPPKMPPPALPTVSPPIGTQPDASKQEDAGLAKFPPPPRKGPPAPLQLGKSATQKMAALASPLDDDSDSDYDDILEVNEIPHAERGRRRTREEDDRRREIQAAKEAAELAAESQPHNTHPPTGQEPASLNAILSGKVVDSRRDLAPPIMSPGLPASPRPMPGMNKLQSPTHPHGMVPLSPRPPRQPIPMPPNSGIPASATAPAGLDGGEALNVAKKNVNIHQHRDSAENQPSPTERKKIFKGLMVDEFPDLLLPPNALPSVDIKVASSRMKPSRASILSLTQLEEDPVFTLAVISRSDRGELWRVEKDTASLSKLDQRLKQCSAFTAKTPDRSLFSGHAPAKIDARRIALEQYMDELLNTPLDINTAVELCKYLSTNTLPPNADETGAALATSQDASTHSLGPDGKPIRSGYLTKRGKNFGGWKMRFFVLDGPHLKYYETPGGPHLGTIKLQNAQIGKQHHRENQSPTRASMEEPETQYRHAFLIGEPKKKDSSSLVKHVLCAESDKERDLWVDALLQWIDHRDTDDSEPPAKSHNNSNQDRQTTETTEQPNKIKKSNPARSQHQNTDSDTLIGVRYDATHAGEAPQLTTTRPKTAGAAPDTPNGQLAHDLSQSKMISGPKDMQLISDATMWGNKTGLSVPSYDEKKQRKRSFFGFGPKTRSSSDGQDSVYGGSDNSSTAPAPHGLHGPIGQVFGANLPEAVRYNAAFGLHVPVPSVVYRCVQFLEAKNAVHEEGIFRLSGSNVVIKQLRERFNTEGDVDLINDEQFYDIHAVASLLKLYLRELPTTILSRELHMDFLSVTELPDLDEKVSKMSVLAQRLPPANGVLLRYLISFLIKIINKSDINKMTVRNVGIVFSPTLNIPAPIFAMFLQNFEGIFGVDAEDYQLSSLPESDSQGAIDSQRFEPPARPSTSSGGSAPSPRLQPRMEAVRDHARSSPTPPLTALNPSRNTPTPPTGSVRPAYEPAHLGQQQPQGSMPVQPVVNARPAYESGYGMPPAIDVQDIHPAPRAAPGYERQTYEPVPDAHNGGHLGPQEHHVQGSSNKRRESSIYMNNGMGYQYQNVHEQIREDPRY